MTQIHFLQVLTWERGNEGCSGLKQDLFPCLLLWRKNSTDRNCEAEKAFIRSKVCVEENRGTQSELCVNRRELSLLHPGSLWVASDTILSVPIFGLTQGPPQCVCVSQPRSVQTWRFLGGCQDKLWAGVSSLPFSLPWTEDLLCQCVRQGNPLNHKN